MSACHMFLMWHALMQCVPCVTVNTKEWQICSKLVELFLRPALWKQTENDFFSLVLTMLCMTERKTCMHADNQKMHRHHTCSSGQFCLKRKMQTTMNHTLCLHMEPLILKPWIQLGLRNDQTRKAQVRPLPDMLIDSHVKWPEFIKNGKCVVWWQSSFWCCLATRTCGWTEWSNRWMLCSRIPMAICLLKSVLDLLELNVVEDCFKTNNVFFKWTTDKSWKTFQKELQHNLHAEHATQRKHFSLIKDIQNVTKAFRF